MSVPKIASHPPINSGSTSTSPIKMGKRTLWASSNLVATLLWLSIFIQYFNTLLEEILEEDGEMVEEIADKWKEVKVTGAAA